MISRAILFQRAMVRALLSGSKTQTRRICKPAADLSAVVGIQDPRDFGQRPLEIPTSGWFGDEEGDVQFACPYGKPGDQLWVRETYFAFGRWETRFSAKKKRDEWHFVDMTLECGHAYCYAESGSHPLPMRGGRDAGVTPGWWKRPAIFMPRSASRITLEITDERVEQLQDISEVDARAEGIADGGCTNCGNPEPCGCVAPSPDARDAYCNLWGQINGPDSWSANPWVWVVEFKRMSA